MFFEMKEKLIDIDMDTETTNTPRPTRYKPVIIIIGEAKGKQLWWGRAVRGTGSERPVARQKT
ncbi:MAG: hypothetical protein HC884_05835 [Chloroflexaceae bacterium]|nr:hypothetical protein [Chloroflexaceae bacterium]